MSFQYFEADTVYVLHVPRGTLLGPSLPFRPILKTRSPAILAKNLLDPLISLPPPPPPPPPIPGYTCIVASLSIKLPSLSEIKSQKQAFQNYT